MQRLSFIILLSMLAQGSDLTPAPDFNLTDIDGNYICLDSLLEQGPVFMTFWALWCKPCIKELDALRPYYEEFNSLGVSFIAVSEDKMRSLPRVKPFAKSHRWEYIVLLDPENKIRDLHNVQIIPTAFVIDQDKNDIFVHQGYKPGEEKVIIEKLRKLLEKEEKSEPEN